jgi:hypothetical protein
MVFVQATHPYSLAFCKELCVETLTQMRVPTTHFYLLGIPALTLDMRGYDGTLTGQHPRIIASLDAFATTEYSRRNRFGG